MAELTPMMQQYVETKKAYQDCILFYRLGDFYEMFFEDALVASKELEITLTGKVVRRAKSTDGFVTFGCHMGSNQQVNRCLALRGL